MAERDDPGFLGRGWAFPPRFDGVGGGVETVSALDDILESLSILFRTRQGERVMRPQYGCALRDLVFEPMDGETEVAIERTISRAVRFFEPRVDLISVDAQVEDALEGRFQIGVEFRVRETNSRHNVVFPYYLREGSLIAERPVVAR